MDRDREHPRVVPEARLHAVAVMHVDVDVGDPLSALREQPRDADGRVVVHAEPRGTVGHRVVETPGRVEGMLGLARPDRPGGRDRGADHERPGLVHVVEDRVVTGPVAEPAPRALLAVPRARRGVDECGRVDQLEGREIRGLTSQPADVGKPVEPVRLDQFPGEQHALGAQRMLQAVVVDLRLGADDEPDALAHVTARIAATVRSTSVVASSSLRQYGGPSMSRSPFAPST